MAYYDLNDAIDSMEASMLKVTIGKKDKHSIVLSDLCSEGIVALIKHLRNELDWDGETILEAIPQLKNLDVVDLLGAVLDGGDDFESILENLESSSQSSHDGSLRVGDVFTSQRTITSVTPSYVGYTDDAGRYHSVQRGSFRSWAKNKRKA